MQIKLSKLSKLAKWQIAEFIFVAVVGTLLHFTYEWSGQSALAAIFSPVNESVWEHLKLLFMPAFLFTIIEDFILEDDYPCLLTVKGKAVLLGMLFIVTFFYTYSGILGKNVTWIDILTFYAATAIYSGFSYCMLTNPQKMENCNKNTGIAIFLLMLFFFIVFTVNVPNIGIFQPNG